MNVKIYTKDGNPNLAGGKYEGKRVIFKMNK